MSDPLSTPPAGRPRRVRPGEVPVLALLTVAALIAYVVVADGRDGTERTDALPPPSVPMSMPAPADAPLPVVTPSASPPSPPQPAAAAMAEAPPAEPPPDEPATVPATVSETPAPPPPTSAVEPDESIVAATAAVPKPPPPPATAASLVEGVRAALAELRCADLRTDVVDGQLSVSGTVTSPEDERRVSALVDALPVGIARWPALAVAPSTLCEPLLAAESPRAANAERGQPLTVALVPDGTLADGQDLVLDLRSVEGAGAVLVDYFTVDGGVVHLLPNPSEPAAALEPGAPRRIGERSGRTRFWTVGPPFGTELIVVVASPAPLFPVPRPEAEPAAAYLPELQRVLSGPAGAGALAATLFITTQGP